jgi:cellulose synthase/poly-beta-1,6-N-acetylglucosamine synthase-like glycosyltransferase
MLEIGLILRVIVLFCLGFPLVVFGLYGSIIIYYNKFKKSTIERAVENNKETFYEPNVTFVIPTHNEGFFISKRIENLLDLDYPQEKLELIFVEDDSDDSTPEIILDYAKKYSSLHLIRNEERKGYSPSMIAGVKAATGEIIILGDAGSLTDSHAVQNLVVHFKDPNVGAVTGKDIILNSDEDVGKSEKLYLRIFDFLRTAESKIDSTFFVKGEATAVRSCLVKDLENCFATFDTAVGLFLRQKGFKTIYDPTVKFYEYAPLTHADRIKQKTIRAANLIRILFSFRHLLFNRKYKKYGLIILPMNFAMLVIAPSTILIGLLFLVTLTFFEFTFSAIIWGIIGLTLLFSLLFSRTLLRTFLDFEYSLIKALYKIVTSKNVLDKIEKVESTRRSI